MSRDGSLSTPAALASCFGAARVHHDDSPAHQGAYMMDNVADLSARLEAKANEI